MEGLLARIVERTLEDVHARHGKIPRGELEARARARIASRRPFAAVLKRGAANDPVRFIAEVKKASPSKGLLDADLDPRAQARIYAEHGAAAVSVVTEPHFFLGEEDFLAQVRDGAPALPVLRKDFHVHELQILEAAAGAADALLLIVAALSADQLKDYLDLARELGIEHLVEASDPREAEAALKAGAKVIGVNNRDLSTFDVDVARTEIVLPVLAGCGAVIVSESGIADRDTVVRLERAGVDALLVGEALVTAADPGALLRALRGLDSP